MCNHHRPRKLISVPKIAFIFNQRKEISMSTEHNKQIVRQFNNAFDRGDLVACAALLSPDCIAYQPGIPQPLNFEAFRQMGQMFLDSFSNANHLYHEQIAEGDYVATHAFWTAVHDRAPFHGMPASGRKLKLEVIFFDRILDGKIVEHRAVFDVMSLMHQLGVTPQPTQG
jgi:steroid delta-isomerase-like uncharacterized protein